MVDSLRIAAPCTVAWESMAGDERVRHCTLCSLNVFNFAEMTRDEIRALLVKTEGRVCARLYKRADGTVITKDCPTGLRALRRRVSRAAAAILTAAFSVTTFASAPRLHKPRNVKLEVEQAATPQLAAFTGIARAEDGTPLPGVTISLRNEAAHYELATVTDINGAFAFGGLYEGMYRVEALLAGVKPIVVEHMVLKYNEITRAQVAMRFDAETVTVGGLAVDEVVQPLGATFQQSLINKLPLQ